MRQVIALIALVSFAAAAPAFGAGKTTGKKPGKADKAAVCDGLIEKRLELSRELQTIDSRVADKKVAIDALAAKDASDVPTIDMTAPQEDVVDLTAPDSKTADHDARIQKIQRLQAEIATLDESRLEIERRAARVKSTLSQSCPQ